MPGKQAKVVSSYMLKRMLHHVGGSTFPARDRAMILLSVKAGLRACEIARLSWPMVLDARGKISEALSIHDLIAKKRSGRRIPLHPDLRRALRQLLKESDPAGAIIRSAKGGCMRPTSVVNWFAALYADLGFEGMLISFLVDVHSSPSLRAMSTEPAVVCVTCNSSLDIDRSTPPERYIDGDTKSQQRLIRLI